MAVFKKLVQDHVRIDLGDGKSFSCPMLPVSSLGEYRAIAEAVTAAKDFPAITAVTARLVALVRTVMPLEYAVERLKFDDLCALAAYLMYGDGDDEPDTVSAEKKMM